MRRRQEQWVQWGGVLGYEELACRKEGVVSSAGFVVAGVRVDSQSKQLLSGVGANGDGVKRSLRTAVGGWELAGAGSAGGMPSGFFSASGGLARSGWGAECGKVEGMVGLGAVEELELGDGEEYQGGWRRSCGTFLSRV